MAMIDDLAVELPRTMDTQGRVKSVLYRAKHFVFDEPASAFCREMAEKNREIVEELQEFALPPFDVMAISHLFSKTDGRRFAAGEVLTLWDHGEFKLIMSPADPALSGSDIAIIPGWSAAPRGRINSIRNDALDVSFDVSPSDYAPAGPNRLRVTTPEGRREMEATADNVVGEFERFIKSHPDDNLNTAFALLAHRHMLDATFLLLHQPRFYTSSFGEARRVIRAGRTVPFYARTEIKLDLAAPRELRRAFLTGARGSPRRHDVRRHFCHYRGDRGCAHHWEPLECDDGKHRWECPSCGMIRIERGPFGRGDANKGFVRQSYAVTAG